MARHSGANIAVDFSDDAGATWQSLGCFTNISLSSARDRFEATCGGDANKVYVLGKKDFTGSLAFIFDDTNEDIFTAADTLTPFLYRLFPNKAALPNYRWEGPLNLDISMEMPVAGAITGTVNYSAAGDVQRLISVITP